MNVNQNTEQKSMNNNWVEHSREDPKWKALWEVTKQWAVMSGFEKDLENYEKLRENIQNGTVGDE